MLTGAMFKHVIEATLNIMQQDKHPSFGVNIRYSLLNFMPVVESPLLDYDAGTNPEIERKKSNLNNFQRKINIDWRDKISK